jgi:hypothetical protein
MHKLLHHKLVGTTNRILWIHILFLSAATTPEHLEISFRKVGNPLELVDTFKIWGSSRFWPVVIIVAKWDLGNSKLGTHKRGRVSHADLFLSKYHPIIEKNCLLHVTESL